MRILLVFLITSGLAPGIQACQHIAVPSASGFSSTQANLDDFNVEFFPVPPHHVGDHLSLRVTYSGPEDIGGRKISIALADQPSQTLETATFAQYSNQAIFYWMLDTEGLEPGFLNFLLEIPEMDLSWKTGVNLLPNHRDETWNWAKVHTNCCTIHYMTGTDAEEDIVEIQQILETQTNEALEQFESKMDDNQTALEEPLSLVLIPTVIGQGGFATDIAVMTYSERNWAGTEFSNIAHHEIVHVLDRHLNDGPRPSLFSEGLAVYFADGHYRDGDPLQRAAALLSIDRYIPITDFVDDFYAAQHEISYLEAGGLVAYMVEIWGQDAFLDFYFNLPEAERDSESISNALEEQYNMNLEELESEFIAYLETLNPAPEVEDNVRLTIETYDMMRRYQKIQIPSAYFRKAWWPPVNRVLEMGIVGDYAPREKTPSEVIIEALFLEVYPALNSDKHQLVEESLDEIAQLLDKAENQADAFSHYSLGWPTHMLTSKSFGP
ncbi:MAG: hypothetical protein ACOCYU_07475 [Brevefilum sp.]